MASASAVVVTLLCGCAFLLLLLCSSNNGSYAYAYINNNGGQLPHDALQVLTTSLLRGPPWHCSPSNPQGNQYYEGSSTMKVVHRHGPCSKLSTTTQNMTDIHTGPTRRLTHQHILSLDQSRVDSIQSRLRLHSNPNPDAADLPAKSGLSIGSANYIITLGLGTPKRDLSLLFDTGTDLTWTQCKPCIKRCYVQKEPIFNPSLSKTYKNVSCSSPQCSQLTSATGNSLDCSSATCVYGIQYGGQSFSIGYFAEETMSLTPTDVFPNFLFGCGQDNEGLFKGAAGLLGLGRGQLSLVSQTASKYGKYFSYCLPSISSSTGHLTLGKGSTPENLEFTPFATNPREMDSFYFVDIIKIRVGGVTLSISQTVFKSSRTIIDSGTIITRLPPVAYTALRATFRKQMKKYPLTYRLSILDTCYDLSGYTRVFIPRISIFFRGDVEVAIDLSGIIYGVDASQVCLAFAGNSDASDVGIIGNAQQQTLEVVYDVAGGKLGFAMGGCS
ncbi:aspartyl protease family protein At5g10770-like isoform X2 [Diospyros lotus]|uniref:aspartyl protease family protein At5g10770-like isoform X2 n=1 Tax=Diospyros lotus TaxID=55363 RepID=UPI0022523197|nr:aspartyl protease family protein At5g10770-like isoform X2 [Diospyros lotus]